MIKDFLQSHRDYIKNMFRNMNIEDAKKWSGYVETLYLTEAYLIKYAIKEK